MAIDDVVVVDVSRVAQPTNADIQKVVDQVAARGGGTVEVPVATFLMEDALHLRSGVHLRARPGATLVKAPSIELRIPDFLGYGHYEFTVYQPDRLRPGMGVHLLDDNAGGFYTTVATITERRGDRLFINRMMNHDYHVWSNARVLTLHSLIEGDGVENATVAGFTLEGRADDNARLNGCRGGGVFLIQCRGVTVQGVTVRDFNGDAISFQQCVDVNVLDCVIEKNRGSGLHPGSGSVRYRMEGNQVRDNGGDGLFYCLRTSHGICRGNTFERNAGVGVSIGERDTHHLIEGNTVRDNGGSGVAWREPVRTSGDHTVLRGNAIGPNDRRGTGAPEVDVPAGLRDLLIEGNTITPREPGGATLRVAAGVEGVHVTGNRTPAGELGSADVLGDPACVTFTAPESFTPVGPDALPLDEARHLGLAKLPPYQA